MLSTTSFSKITVNDICAQAMVSRATFYTHFEDKYHLLRHGLEQIRHQLLQDVDPTDRQALIGKTVALVHQRADICRNLMTDGSQELNSMLLSLFQQRLEENLLSHPQQLATPAPILAIFVAGGSTQLLRWWLEAGMDLTQEQMVAHLTELSTLML